MVRAEAQRQDIVKAVREGLGLRAAARQFRVSLHTVQRWVARAGTQPLDQVLWSDRLTRPEHIQRTATVVEERVLELRKELRDTSTLGEFGAEAIHAALREGGQ